MSSGKVGANLDWSFGMRNSAGKYLTAETFGNKIVCAAGIMKKKQIFFLEQKADSDVVFIKSHLNKYLTVDGDGNFTCDQDDQGDEQAMVIEPQADGRWAIKSKKYGYYTGGTGENLRAFTKEISEDRLWTIHLAMHPQVNVYNVQRKAYVHCVGKSMSTDEVVPWGDDATITMVFFDEDGTYGLQASNHSYLTATGALSESAGADCHFILEFSGGMVSFKSKTNGKYITALGAAGTLKANKSAISKDEQFILQDSFPQISLKGKNGKYLSVKQGVELSAMADKVTDTEIFQLEPLGVEDFEGKAGTFALKTNKPLYWHLDSASIQATHDSSADPSACFTIEWHGASVAFKASNGKYVEQQMNKYLTAKSDSVTDSCLFTYEIVNRPSLVLRGEYGFVGVLPSGLLECNKSLAHSFTMKIVDGKISLSDTSSGKFWKVQSNGVTCAGDASEEYEIEIYDNSKLAIKCEGKYFQSFQNGAFTLTGTKIDKYTLFEY